MGLFGVVECHAVIDDTPGLESVAGLFEINRLLLQAPPQPFDKDVVSITATPIHRDAHPSFGQRRDPCSPGKLVALISIYDLVQSWRLFWVQPFSPSNKKSSSIANLSILACSSLSSASFGPLFLSLENTLTIPSIACRFHVLT